MINTPPKISVIICTYNRASLLEEALQSLVNQTAGKSLYEVIVVNNNSTDNTQEIAERFAKGYDNFRVVFESQQGLSHARNRGFKEANAHWISYLDDDARVFDNYVQRINYVIVNYNFDCFGGIFLPWYKYGKPKWLPDDLVTKKRNLEDIGILKEGYVPGSVIVLKKSILEHVGGFLPSLGMNGSKISYGEDGFLVRKIRKEGFVIGFDPWLKVEHLVNIYKLTPWWYVKSEYAKGRVFWDTFEVTVTWGRILRSFVGGCYQICKGLLLSSPKLLQNEYYLQNWIIDVFCPGALRIGTLASGIRKKLF